jgi:uncharacterized SAM-binding protein YcdF (DUF218 family)
LGHRVLLSINGAAEERRADRLGAKTLWMSPAINRNTHVNPASHRPSNESGELRFMSSVGRKGWFLFPANQKIRRLLLVALGLFVLLLLLAFALWAFPQQILTVDSGPVKADVLVVLGGGSTERPRRAAELFHAGEAPRLLCSGEGDCRSNQRILINAGVPREIIHLECESRNTSENAQRTIALLREQGVKRVIIVTSWYHSRRALNCFEHHAPEMEFYSRPSYFAMARNDWKPMGIEGYVWMEYAKNLGYIFRHGVWPF